MWRILCGSISALCFCSAAHVKNVVDASLPCRTYSHSLRVHVLPFSALVKSPRWCILRTTGTKAALSSSFHQRGVSNTALTFLYFLEQRRHAYAARVVEVISLVAVISCAYSQCAPQSFVSSFEHNTSCVGGRVGARSRFMLL